MNVIEKFWKWHENLNTTDFKLGEDIRGLLADGQIIKSNSIINAYTGIDDYPAILLVENNLIESVFFTHTYFPLPDFDVWGLEYIDLTDFLNGVLEQTNEHENEEKLYVVFKDDLVVVVGLIRNNTHIYLCRKFLIMG